MKTRLPVDNPDQARASGWRSDLQRFMAALLASAALAVSSPATLAQHHVPVDLDQLVQGSGSIFVGQLVDARPRWNDRHNLILTDYRFRVERAYFDGRIGAFDQVLTQAGGTLDGETHQLSSNPQLHVGERYLVFIDPDAGRILSPFFGGDQGVYQITANGIARALSGRQDLPLDALLVQIDRRVQERGNAPPRFEHAGPMSGVTYPAKRAVPPRASGNPVAPVASSLSPQQAQPVSSPEIAPVPVGNAVPVAVDRNPDQQGLESGNEPAYSFDRAATRPIVWDEWPHDWWTSPHDQYMMSEWNRFADNLNRISGAELGTWAWGNNRFEMVGFPDNAAMIAQFGAGWGATTLAITYSRWFGSGPIVESDIALNPAYCWTLDEARSADPADSCWGIDATTMHELGHGWGLNHPWESQDVWWDSVMNYSPKAMRFPLLHTDDTTAARSAYPGTTVDVDGLISMYRTSDDPNSQHATYTDASPSATVLYHGDALVLGAVQTENTGRLAWSDPQLDVYLAQNWHVWTGAYPFLTTYSYSVTVAPFTTQGLNVPQTTIAATVPTGRYYPTLYLRVVGDQLSANNTAAQPPNRVLTIRNVVPTLVPSAIWQLAPLGRIGPNGEWNFYLQVVVGGDYELSLCPALGGGSANFDTVIELSGGASNDDYCGLASRVRYTSLASGNQWVTVRGFNVNAQGNFQLAYRRVPDDTIFRNGFD